MLNHISSKQFRNILPLAVQWAKAKEKVILEHGTALSPQFMQDAKKVGVKYPERVRVYKVPQIPVPKHPILKSAAEASQLISPATIGMSLGYGIFILSNFSNDRYIIRSTFIGRAFIGTTFAWWDFAHYAIGCFFGWLWLRWLVRL